MNFFLLLHENVMCLGLVWGLETDEERERKAKKENENGADWEKLRKINI
jgi:hypothetical protein